MNSIRRLLLTALAAFVGGTALAQGPGAVAPGNAGTLPLPKNIIVKVDNGVMYATQGQRSLWNVAPYLMPGNQIIQVVPSNKEAVLVEATPTDPNNFVITGVRVGIYKIYVTVGANEKDPNAQTREFSVVVQPDYEFLKLAITRAVPTANIDIIPVPGPNGSNIILTGYVNRPEDAETAMRIAEASFITGSITNTTGGSTTGQAGAQNQPNTPPAANNNGNVNTQFNTSVSSVETRIGQVINAIQVGGLQHVQIEVVFASVNRSKLRERGTDFVVNGTQGIFSSTIAGLISPGFNGAASTVGSRANIVAGITPAGFLAAIHVLKQEGIAKFLTEPKVVTQSGRPAVIRSGGQQAVLSSTGGGLGSVSVALEQVGTTMSVIPIVYGNGKIYLEVSPQVRAVNNAFGITTSAGFSPGFSEQSANASVMLESGQTFAIGGLLENTVQAQAARVPVLGELPYIGFAFSDKTYREVESELIILVTPRLVDALDCCQVPKRVPGRETRSPDDYEFYLECLLEAPRGQRQVWNGRCYQAAYKCDPTYGIFPCKGNVCGGGNCGTGVNQAGGTNCNVPTTLPAAAGAAPTLMPTPTTAPVYTAPVNTAPLNAAPVNNAPATLPIPGNSTQAPVTEPVIMPQQVAPPTPVSTEPVNTTPVSTTPVNTTPAPVEPPSPLAAPVSVPETPVAPAPVPGPATETPATAPVAPPEPAK